MTIYLQLKEGRVYFGSWLEGSDHHGGEVWWKKIKAANWVLYAQSQESGWSQHSRSTDLLL